MHTLIVIAHPNPESLTQSVAAQIAEGIKQNQSGGTVEIADLAAEGFDPRYSMADIAVHRGQAAPPEDVVREQQRIDRADAIVLVYPVYWWSVPALLKGWVDRVFSNNWAFEYTLDGGLVKKLRRLKAHHIGIAGGDLGAFERHGYLTAMKTQIDHGIFDYCGMEVLTSELMYESETQDPQIHLKRGFEIGGSIAGAVSQAVLA